MVKWAVEVYDNLIDAATAIELIDNTERLIVVPFKDGGYTKVLVATGGAFI